MLAMYNDCSGFGGLACSLRVIVVHQFGLDLFAYIRCDAGRFEARCPLERERNERAEPTVLRTEWPLKQPQPGGSSRGSTAGLGTTHPTASCLGILISVVCVRLFMSTSTAKQSTIGHNP